MTYISDRAITSGAFGRVKPMVAFVTVRFATLLQESVRGEFCGAFAALEASRMPSFSHRFHEFLAKAKCQLVVEKF